jgi:predicted dehydrogenase
LRYSSKKIFDELYEKRIRRFHRGGSGIGEQGTGICAAAGPPAAAPYGVPEKRSGYENYDSIADNKDMDAVCIALPNYMRAEYTIRAAKGQAYALREVDDCLSPPV